jgi:hypothetical protein
MPSRKTKRLRGREKKMKEERKKEERKRYLVLNKIPCTLLVGM